MTKLSRKLLLSIVTVALALVTLGATTFAWFTLSTRAEVEGFEVEVTSGAGIEISADGMNYSNYIKKDDIYAAINRAGSSTVLDHVTSPDGIKFTTIGFSEKDGQVQLNFNNPATSGWTEFKLWFRSPEKDVKVYMLHNTTVTSTGITWVADADFNLKENLPMKVGDTYTLYGANAVRISTTENTVTYTSGSGFSYTPGTGANVFELGSEGDQELGQQIKTGYGSVAYYNSKNPTNQITATHIQNANATLPKVYGYESLPELNDLNTPAIKDTHVPVATLEAESNISGTTLYYGQITVRIWLEGWDPDMFNAIMADEIQIHLFFGGLSPSSLLSISTSTEEDELNLEVEAEESFTVTVAGNYTGKILVSSNNEGVATVTIDQNQETTQVTVKAVGVGNAKITIYLQKYPGVRKEITVNVSNSSNSEG